MSRQTSVAEDLTLTHLKRTTATILCEFREALLRIAKAETAARMYEDLYHESCGMLTRTEAECETLRTDLAVSVEKQRTLEDRIAELERRLKEEEERGKVKTVEKKSKKGKGEKVEKDEEEKKGSPLPRKLTRLFSRKGKESNSAVPHKT
ncbi:hypothetical protein BC936DRAFT_139835 [Jimgerdemannia flammicorona]|uniref:Uncharacterized protein n=1 Tax=Jimgerdemannia flammicorona TaxID=994334 RepID=A0A433DHE3_9FUNG|nr:hypothetical protein BC936DRAFT_139835 [Jimgerdemannia flammicorona]